MAKNKIRLLKQDNLVFDIIRDNKKPTTFRYLTKGLTYTPYEIRQSLEKLIANDMILKVVDLPHENVNGFAYKINN